MRLREQEWDQQRSGWQSAQQQYKQYIDELLMEKEEMIRCHTLETAELRKKNAILIEQTQKLESSAMSAVPSSTGFSADFSDFDHLTMESSPWDNFSMVNEFNMDMEPKPETSLVVLPKKEKATNKDDDRTATSGLLLMLLLCGAWVTSSNTATSIASIPAMPEDVRVASAAVLDNIYKDAGLQSVEIAQAHNQHAGNVHKTPSQCLPRTTLSASEFPSLSKATFPHQLTALSEQQEREQVFSLSSDQYNRLTTDEHSHGEPSSPPAPGHRRNLGEALAAMRKEKRGSAAEIYTRSLMWDEVPANVVRDFARMVAECNAGYANLQNGEALD